MGSHDGDWKLLELEERLLPRDASVVVLDDVLAGGRTLCAVLQLLNQVGISSEKIHVIVVAEFPAHGGRGFLREQGFGRVNIQSLLVLRGF
jgi:adenine/guanine phosphoribosyltransferase-like PRPP-binding protein